jgi:hypothetical protein
MPAEQCFGLDEQLSKVSTIEEPVSPASSARSEERSAGRATWRRSTATSWRSMTTSAASSLLS